MQTSLSAFDFSDEVRLAGTEIIVNTVIATLTPNQKLTFNVLISDVRNILEKSSQNNGIGPDISNYIKLMLENS